MADEKDEWSHGDAGHGQDPDRRQMWPVGKPGWPLPTKDMHPTMLAPPDDVKKWKKAEENEQNEGKRRRCRMLYQHEGCYQGWRLVYEWK